MRRYILEIVCNCNAHITLRYEQEKNGDRHYVNCWNCGRSVEANGSAVKVAGQSIPRNRVMVILDEPFKR